MDRIKENICVNCFKSFESKDSVNNKCPTCMVGHEWKQWKGFKRLHAVKLYGATDKFPGIYVSICNIAPSDIEDIFIEPITIESKCKNCEREIRKAIIIQLIKKG